MTDQRTYNFREVSPASADWALIERAPEATVFHCRQWSDYVAAMGYKPFIAEVLADGEVAGHFVGATKRVLLLRMVMAPSMGTGTYAQGLCMQRPVSKAGRIGIYQQLVSWLFRQGKASYVQICDWQLRSEYDEDPGSWHDADLDGRGIYYNLRSTYFLDIARPLDELWAGLHYKSCKYSINKARKQGLTVKVVEREEDIEPFVDQHYRHVQAMLARKQSLGLPCQRRRNMSALCHALFPGRVLMLQVVGHDEQGREVSMSSGIFANGTAGTTYFTGASFQEYMRYCPNELMVWEAVSRLHERGAGSFIFGGVDAYKKKFGSRYAYVPVMIFSRFAFLLRVRRLLKRGYVRAVTLLWHLKNKQ